MLSRYLLFHKPFNVLCQFSLGTGGTTSRTTLASFITVPGVYPVGRLDYDSEGLLLLTDDGPLQHRLSDPRYGHPRSYWAQVEGSITSEAIATLKAGLVIQDYRTRPCHARAVVAPPVDERIPPIRYRRFIPVSWVELTLTEGRNRQVRRMTAAVGFPTLRLIRIAIGPLKLDGLAPGQWRDLTALELSAIRA